MKISRNFTLAELCVTDTGLPNEPDATASGNLCTLVFHILQPLREALQRPVVINSAYRSPRVNKAVGGVPTSQHALGQAADIQVAGMDPLELAQFIRRLELPYDQLIREPTWVHVSYGPRHRHLCLTMRDGKYFPGLH